MTNFPIFTPGLVFLLLFGILSGVQEVYIGAVVQRLDPFVVVAFSTLMATLFFSATRLFTRKSPLTPSILRSGFSDILGLNGSTAVSWLGFFISVRTLEPAIAATLAYSIGPILSTFGLKKARLGRTPTKSDYGVAWGILIGGLSLVICSYDGKSAVGRISGPETWIGILTALFSGVGIVFNTFFSKRLNGLGFSASRIMASRFWLLIGIAVLGISSGAIRGLTGENYLSMGIVTIFGVILPLYVLQLAIGRSEPFTVSMVLAAMPVFSFFIQYFDPRLRNSLPSLLGIVACVIFTGFSMWPSRKTS